jgi:GDP-mannose 6-dehydrogenase
MLLQIAGGAGLDLPLLRNTLASNEAHLKRVIAAVLKHGHARVGLNGLAFKAGTDDLRESPIVLIAETLIGKGYDVKIHDPAIETSWLTGTNRNYIGQHIPHLSSRIVHSLDELIEHAEILVLTRNGDQLLQRVVELGKHPAIVDLQGHDHLVKGLPEATKRFEPSAEESLRETNAVGVP